MVPLLSWFSRVSHMATSGTLVTPSVMIMIPLTERQVNKGVGVPSQSFFFFVKHQLYIHRYRIVALITAMWYKTIH